MASLAVDDELHRRLKIKCSEMGLKIKDVVNQLIADWLKKHEK
ncbi:MAG: plasmid partition protein ParG [Candidatus Aenigmatarchaeota archaeon]